MLHKYLAMHCTPWSTKIPLELCWIVCWPRWQCPWVSFPPKKREFQASPRIMAPLSQRHSSLDVAISPLLGRDSAMWNWNKLCVAVRPADGPMAGLEIGAGGGDWLGWRGRGVEVGQLEHSAKAWLAEQIFWGVHMWDGRMGSCVKEVWFETEDA